MKLIKVILLSLLLSCGSGRLPKVGEIAIVASKSPQGLLAARSKEAYEKMDRVSQAIDETGLKALIDAGEVVILDNNTAGRVLDIDFGIYRIRVQTGQYTNQEFLVASQFVDTK